MIRTIFALALAGIALTPFAEKAVAPLPKEQAGVDLIETSSMAQADRKVFEAVAPSGLQCRILVDVTVRRDAAEGRLAQVADDCKDVYPGLETVSYWLPTDLGNVRLIDVNGKTILEIGVSDGFAYEAYLPATAQVSLVDIDG